MAAGTAATTMTYDQFMAALCLWREARNQSLPGKAAVYAVLVNRTQDDKKRWPKTLPGVVTQPFQFSSFNLGEPNSVKFPSRSSPPDWGAWLDCITVVTSPLQADPTNGANHYHDSSIPPPAKAWLGPIATTEQLLLKRTCQIGSFSFYKL